MRNHFCVRSDLYKNKRRIFSWNCFKVLHVFLLTIVLSPFKGMCSRGDMLSENNASSVSSGGRELTTAQPTPLTVKKETESKIRGNKTSTVANISLNSDEEHMKEQEYVKSLKLPQKILKPLFLICHLNCFEL